MPSSPSRVSSLRPQLGHLRVVPVPDCEPPFDDEPQVTGPRGAAGSRRAGVLPAAPGQGSLALAFVLPSGAPALPSPPVAEAGPEASVDAMTLPDPARDTEFGPQRTSRAALPNARSWAALLGQAVVEVLAGHRPATQLLRWTSTHVHSSVTALSLDERGRRSTGRRSRAVVRTVRVFEPSDGVAEAAVVVRDRTRCWAMALRLEGVDGRWVCTALVLG